MAISFPFPFTLEGAREFAGNNPRLQDIGFELISVSPRSAEAMMTVMPRHLAPNGFLHAGVVTLFADVTCGTGSFAALPGPDYFYTTMDTVTNYFGTATEGKLICVATAKHVGRRSQVWDAEVRAVGKDKLMAAFRCTQLVLENR